MVPISISGCDRSPDDTATASSLLRMPRKWHFCTSRKPRRGKACLKEERTPLSTVFMYGKTNVKLASPAKSKGHRTQKRLPGEYAFSGRLTVKDKVAPLPILLRKTPRFYPRLLPQSSPHHVLSHLSSSGAHSLSSHFD
jgi:hypothetical protein